MGTLDTDSKFYSNYLKKFIKSVLFLRFCIHLLSVKIKIQYAIQIEINKKINIEIINLLIAIVSNFTYDCREFWSDIFSELLVQKILKMQ